MSGVDITDDGPGQVRSAQALLREAARNRQPFRLYGVDYQPVPEQGTVHQQQVRLHRTVTELALVLDLVRRRLEHDHPDLPSEMVQDPNGRYVLLDALAALSLAQAALLRSMSGR